MITNSVSACITALSAKGQRYFASFRALYSKPHRLVGNDMGLKVLVQYIACTIEPIRPNRSYKRIKRKPNKCGFYMNYKRAK